MPHKGPDTHRTPRTRALEIGTRPEGFTEMADFCAQCGQPIAAGQPHGHHVEQPAGTDAGGPKSIDTPTPFKIG
jgi:hypothetical protein